MDGCKHCERRINGFVFTLGASNEKKNTFGLPTVRRVACAISGGVDSAVAAYLLKKKGHDVVGVFMRNWDVYEADADCTVDRDCEDAAYICKKFEIPFQEVNFVKDYWNEVFSEFLQDYEAGITPNPDILCNKKIKFDAFFNYAMNTLAVDAIATGHYVRTTFGENLEHYNSTQGVHLLRGVDIVKDQSFFMSQVPQNALQKSMFPIGSYTKRQVKKIASEIDLKNIASKNESMGICFIGNHNFQKFMQEYISSKPGNFVDVETGQVVGKHLGFHLWTVGQRCRLVGFRYPYYVLRKDLVSNDILVAPGTHHPSLYSQLVTTCPPYWIHSKPAKKLNRFRCQFCFQHCDPLSPCFVTEQTDGTLTVKLHPPLRALTPGQFAVFYVNEVCLGSARILNVGSSLYRPELMKS